jgi:sec-independent protein translocase protein TatB
MFDVGFAELFLLGLIGLLVLGPERLPAVARTIGGFVRKARVSWISLRKTIEAELNEANIAEPIKKAGEEFKQISKNLADTPSFHLDKSTSAGNKQATGPDENENSAPVEPDSGKPGT